MAKFIPALALVFVLQLAVASVETAYLGDSSAQEFSAGERRDVYVDGSGALVLGPERTEIADGFDYAWCIAAAPDGAVYAGTLPGGKLYRSAGGKSAVFFETGEAGVFSIAVLPDGVVIAGTGPNGKLFRIAPDGTGSVLATLDAQYVFGLAVSADGVIYAATGGASGRVYRVSGDKADVLYESPSAHLTSVVLAADGSVYASSGDRSAIYKISPDGAASVVFSTPQRVVQDLAIAGDGSLYAATASIAEEKPGDEEAVKNIMSEIQSRQQDASPNPAPAAPPAKRTYRVVNAVFRIAPDGRAQPVFTISGGLIMSVLPRGDKLLCATSGVPGVFLIDPERRGASKIFDPKSDHVLDLAATPGGRYVAALGMPGKVIEFGMDFSRTGSFTGRILDGRNFVRWGRLNWTGDVPTGASLAFFVRCGNSPVADSTWTQWKEIDASSGGAETGLPQARFVQYRVDFVTAAPDATPLVREVSIAGLPVNLPPVLGAISAGGDSVRAAPQQAAPREGQEPPKEQPGSGDSPALAGVVEVRWKADDPNGDKLVFELFFREASVSRFVRIADDLSDAKYSWDTRTVPDGAYYMRVTASDRPSNGSGTELTALREDGPFTVDNTPPVLGGLTTSKDAGGVTIALTASDAASALASASYSVDSGKWESLLPADGIFDSKNENLVVKIPKADAAIVVVRVLDRAGNSAAVITEIK